MLECTSRPWGGRAEPNVKVCYNDRNRVERLLGRFKKRIGMKIRISNCCLIGLFVFMSMSWCIWGEGYFISCGLSPDGVSYLRMAEAAARGHLFNPNGVAGHDGWFAVWPLGYPWCIALVIKITSLDAFTSARIVATLITGGILLVLARCARSAFPVLALSLLNLSFCGVFRVSYSEQPYVLALLALCVVLSRKDENRKIACFAIAGLCIATFLFRYVGVFAIFWSIAASYLAAKLERRTLGMVRAAACAAIAVVIFAGGYLFLNHIMCGAFTGGHPTGMSESFLALLRRTFVALLNETQAAFFAALWAGMLLVTAGPGMLRKKSDEVKDEGTPDGMVFVLFGLLCNGTVVVLRFLMPFDPLGFRLLCPGTTLLVLGLVLKIRSRLRVDWTVAINAVPMRRMLVFLALAAVPAFNILPLELEIRRTMHLPSDPWYGSYKDVRAQVMEKYAAMPPGTQFEFPANDFGIDYWIDFLRPDIIAHQPDMPNSAF